MPQQPHHPRSLDDVKDRLERAERADDRARLELLEELYSALEQELDAGEAASAGR